MKSIKVLLVALMLTAHLAVATAAPQEATPENLGAGDSFIPGSFDEIVKAKSVKDAGLSAFSYLLAPDHSNDSRVVHALHAAGRGVDLLALPANFAWLVRDLYKGKDTLLKSPYAIKVLELVLGKERAAKIIANRSANAVISLAKFLAVDAFFAQLSEPGMYRGQGRQSHIGRVSRGVANGYRRAMSSLKTSENDIKDQK